MAPAFATPFATPAIFARLPQPPSACTRRSSLVLSAPRPRAALSPDPSALSSSDQTPPSSEMPTPPSTAPAAAAARAADAQRIASVRTQMEFWFSASNLRRDWYIRRQMDPDAWVDPSVFLLFNRVKNLNATLADIIAACRLSPEIEVSAPSAASFGDDAGQTRVRRSPQLPDFRDDDDGELTRSFLLKGIPADATITSLQAVFEPIAPVVYVRIYRNQNADPAAVPAPRALVCFADDAAAEAVFARFRAGPPPGAEAFVLARRRVAPGQLAGGAPQTTVSVPSAGGVRPTLFVCQITGLEPNLDWKTLHRAIDSQFSVGAGQSIRYLMHSTNSPLCHITVVKNDATLSLINSLVDTGIDVDGNNVVLRLLTDEEELRTYWRLASEHQEARNARRAERESSDRPRRHPIGVIIKVSGLVENAAWRDIKGDLGRMGLLVYLNHERGATTCYARFATPEEAIKVRDALVDEEQLLAGSSVHAFVIDGEEEEEYWARAHASRAERKNRQEE